MSLPKPFFQDKAVTIYHGDSRAILPELGKIDILVTDPPYGLNFPYLSYVDSRESLKELIDTVITPNLHIFRRSIILCGPTQISMYPSSEWVSCATWNTTGSFGKFGYNQWTPILVYGKDLPGFGNVNGVTKTDVIRISGGAGVGFMRDSEEKRHTCPKPLNLMKLIIARYTEEDSLIIDPFSGSGTTGRAAKDMGRKAVLIEIEEKYCEIAAKRMSQQVLDFEGE